MKTSYRISEIPVHLFPAPFLDSRMYLLLQNGRGLAVDPCDSREAEALLEKEGARDLLVLLTHEHYDHISGVNRLRELLPCRVVCSEACAQGMADPRKNAAAYWEALFPQGRRNGALPPDPAYACQADRTYRGRLELEWEGLALELRELPGHSPGNQLILAEGKYAFTGDSLIPGRRVVTRLPGGSRRVFREKAAPVLAALGPDTVIFPGHGEPGLLRTMIKERGDPGCCPSISGS